MSNDTFGKRLRHLRKEAGKNQMEVARELRVRFPYISMSQTTLSVLEMREQAPTGETLDALCEYFSVAPAYFLDGAETPYFWRVYCEDHDGNGRFEDLVPSADVQEVLETLLQKESRIYLQRLMITEA